MGTKSGPGEGSVKCSEAPPSARGTEGYAVGLLGGTASAVDESGLKGGAGALPGVAGSAGATELRQSPAKGAVNG